MGYAPLAFFDFVVPGMMLAGIGVLYTVLFVPFLLKNRSNMAQALAGRDKEFVAEFDIAPDSKLIGEVCEEGKFKALGDVRMRMIQRGGYLILPPFEGYVIQAGDILIGAATRKSLTQVLSSHPGFLLAEEDLTPLEDEDDSPAASATGARVLAEIMITPASRLIDMSMENAAFDKQFGVIVLGIQRRARVVRRRLGRIRLEAGDVLLVAGRRSVIDGLQNNTDFIMLSGSKRDMPVPGKAGLAAFIFMVTVASAAVGVLSIPVAAITGSVAMIASGCLNIRQAMRALDRKIFLLVGSMLALGTAMQATGGIAFFADQILSLPFLDSPFKIISALFLIVAVATNLLTNNACAILFTPVAVSLAENMVAPQGLEHSLSFIMAVTVIFAANASFASPIGYQTNLLVMGPAITALVISFARACP